MRSFVADGNFKADHLKQKTDSTDVWLTNGEGFMTNVERYQKHLEVAMESKQVDILSVVAFLPAHCKFDDRNQPVTDIERN